ncbi:FliI/YscN family ATPase [Marinivivus vitaminiproducens]|uniref:FliI/YscN family ATPase n=1 Tax=Marinivivus vitaminiproducens TaxID=3035935 RepID=UPI00279A4C81|nr:FliI/YscN family ATPase [Geminicoccaceae bacterium SCSIO 64248]
MTSLRAAASALDALAPVRVSGRVTAVRGGLVEASGLAGLVAVGSACRVARTGGEWVAGEVVGMQGQATVLALHGHPAGLAADAAVELVASAEPRPCDAWLGRVIDAFARPLDDAGPLPQGPAPYALRATPPPALARRTQGPKVATGVRVLDTFLPLCRGQRIGLFAGSGVGKSTLMAMLARHVAADVVVIGLIGERGKEVSAFLEDTLGADGLARAVVVVSTSDQPPLTKRRAAQTTLAVAEYFRDRGHHVLCLLDSVTRYAEAQREIGLAAGEPPTTRAFPPSTFSEMAALLERAGPGARASADGDITAVFTVLVQGGDMEEPVADNVRAILDGHVVLERAIAERGRFPAIDVLKSVSRALPGCHGERENALIRAARRHLAHYDSMATMIRLGAYQAGSDAATDAAIRIVPVVEAFLGQAIEEATPPPESFERLGALLEDDGA